MLSRAADKSNRPSWKPEKNWMDAVAQDRQLRTFIDNSKENGNWLVETLLLGKGIWFPRSLLSIRLNSTAALASPFTAPPMTPGTLKIFTVFPSFSTNAGTVAAATSFSPTGGV